MKITRHLIIAHRTQWGAWTRMQIESLGLNWPARHGWIDRIEGTEITEAQFNNFVNGKTVRAKQFKKIRNRDAREFKELYPEESKPTEFKTSFNCEMRDAPRTQQDCTDCPNLKQATERINELQTRLTKYEEGLPWD